LFSGVTTSTLGLDPPTQTEPSFTKVATEWYMRGIVEAGSDVSHIEPGGCETFR